MATLSVTEDCEQLRKAFAGLHFFFPFSLQFYPSYQFDLTWILISVYVVDYFGSSDLFMIVIPFFPNDEHLLLKLLDFEYFLGGCTDRT